ncbi:MAG: hypothetical protein EXR73_01315 [Myxococcales bacterium]|nr:hypothetical protein [Myxococcales bacterium]
MRMPPKRSGDNTSCRGSGSRAYNDRVARRASLVSCALAATISSACDGEGGLVYEGTAGQAVSVELMEMTPTVAGSIDGAAPVRFLVDTGAPITILDVDSFPDLTPGPNTVSLDAFGLRFPEYDVAAWDLFATPPGTLDGIIGGDLLIGFALSVDYRGERAWLADPFDPALLPGSDEVEPERTAPVFLLGGGRSQIPTGHLVHVPPTRVIAGLRLEGRMEPIAAVIDTGATSLVLEESLLDELGDSARRPRLGEITVVTANGPVAGYWTRVYRAGLEGGDAAPVSDVPVLVIPGTELFAAISAEVGLPVRAIVGGGLLRYDLTTIDYPAELLRFSRYVSTDHIPVDEFVSVGFTVVDDGAGDWRVDEVYSGTDAFAEGLLRGESVLRFGGRALAGLSLGEVYGLLSQYVLGDEVPVAVARPGGVAVLSVLVEDLLPSYLEP